MLPGTLQTKARGFTYTASSTLTPRGPGAPPLDRPAGLFELTPASPQAFQFLLPHLLFETFYLHGDQWALLPVKSKGD